MPKTESYYLPDIYSHFCKLHITCKQLSDKFLNMEKQFSPLGPEYDMPRWYGKQQ